MDAAEGPELATVIPVYNEVEHIEACLLSLLEQTIEPARHMIVVLDGGSTDGTQRVVKASWRSIKVMITPSSRSWKTQIEPSPTLETWPFPPCQTALSFWLS